MKSKKLLVLLVACLGLGFVSYRFVAPRHHVNREGFERIQVGMHINEVQQILGGPPGDYSTGPAECDTILIVTGESVGTRKSWLGDEGRLNIWFDNHEMVTDKLLFTGRRVGETSLLNRLRQWFGR
jgi:hypothetical protein